MLYIIGLGLNVDSISKYGLSAVKKCKKVYLENYTVDFPYSEAHLKEVLGNKKLIPANRNFVESLRIIDKARKQNVCLLVYGSPLTATTHISLIEEARASGIKYQVIYNSSILDAVAETGLQLYKFGKVASMPTWKSSYKPDSFMKIVKENKSIKAHSLILVDIGLDFQDALNQLEKAAEKHKINLNKIVVCQALGTKHKKIFYKKIRDYKEYTGIKKPYCLILPDKLHFVEKEILEGY